jgi:mono/diheme cytochrome c family protein
VTRPDPGKFGSELVGRGAALAAVGNCIACHTVPGGHAFAGGLAIPTPFGTVYSSNISPDEATGIGNWREAAFIRAMRDGVDRSGNQLYPAFPYDHFTKVADDDDRALYAYLMTRQAVSAKPPANDLSFPFNLRPLIAGWKFLNFRPGVFAPKPDRSAESNRGAYLVEGLGHCGSCHTPRNTLGAERHDADFAGGTAEGCNAYAIGPASPAPIPWTRETLAFYLRNGFHPEHGVARGPMAEVTGNLAGLPDADIFAIATYVADRMGKPSSERLAQAKQLAERVNGVAGTQRPAEVPTAPAPAGDRGAEIYASACAPCHRSGRPQPYGGLDFRLSTAIQSPNPQNIVNVTLFGLPPGDGEASAIMPGFGDVLSDADMVALLGYLGRTFSDRLAWQGLDTLVADTRSGAIRVAIRPAQSAAATPPPTREKGHLVCDRGPSGQCRAVSQRPRLL